MSVMQVVPGVYTSCAICGDDDAFADPGMLIFKDGYAEAELGCRMCWQIFVVATQAWLKHLEAEGQTGSKWITAALQDLSGAQAAQSVPARDSERNETV